MPNQGRIPRKGATMDAASSLLFATVIRRANGRHNRAADLPHDETRTAYASRYMPNARRNGILVSATAAFDGS